MAENLQDLQEVMKDEVPNLRELTVNRICDLLDKETESDKVLARDLPGQSSADFEDLQVCR